MGYRVLGKRDDKWQPRKGLEGPFFYANGRVLYYSPSDGKYWDPVTDWFVEQDDMNYLNQLTIDMLAKS